MAEGSKGAAVLESEGIRQADIMKAEGAKLSAILRAEGDAQAMERMALAQAQAIRSVRDGLSGTETDAAAYLIAARYLETLKEMTSGKDNKVVYVPYEATGVLGALGMMKNLFDRNTPPPLPGE